MKRIHCAVLCSALAVALPAASAAQLACGTEAALDAPVRLEYAVTASRSPLMLSGDGAVVYRRNADAYVMESTLKAAGLFEAQQHSAGTVGVEGLVPRSFAHRTGRRPELRVEFDWAEQRVVFSQGTTAPVRPRMQDRLSLLLQLSWQHRANPSAAEFVLPVAGHRRVSDYLFRARGGESLDLPAGRFETVKFERYPDGSDELLEVWLAPALCSLPVRVRFSDEKGLVVEQRLRAVRLPAP